MKKLCVLIVFVLSCFSSSAQTWVWDSLTTGDWFPKLVKGEAGHVYRFDRFGHRIVKYDHNVALIWQQTLPQSFSITSVSVDADTTLLVCGSFSGTLSIQGNTVSSYGSSDVLLISMTTAGNARWMRQGGSSGDDYASDVSAGPDNYYITGLVFDTAQFSAQTYAVAHDELFVAKYRKDGTLDTVVLSRSIGQPYNGCSGWEIECDLSGNVVIMAAITNSVIVDTDTLCHWGYMAGAGPLIIKFDSLLSYQWHHYIPVSPGTAHSLRVGKNDEVFFVEHHWWKYTSHSIIRKIPAIGNSVTAIYSNGYGYLHDLSIDSCNNLYFTGWNERWTHSGNPPSKYFLRTGQVSASGNLHWLRQDSSLKYRSGLSVVDLAPNYCMVAGQFDDSLQLAHHLTDSGSITHNPYRDIYGGQFLATLQTTVGVPTNISQPSDLNFCAGAPSTLQVSGNGAISWYSVNPGGNPIATGPYFTTPPLSPGTYTYYAEASSCTMTTGRLPVTVTVNTNPTVTVANGIVCKPGSFTINPTGAPNFIYSSGSAVVSPSVTTSYSVTGISAEGCTNSAVCEVSVMPSLQPTINTSINFMCYGQTAILTVIGATTYTWNTGEINQPLAVSPTIHTNYSVEVSNENGCKGSAFITQYVTDCVGLTEQNSLAPSIFPNPTEGLLFVTVEEVSQIQVLNNEGKILFVTELDAGTNAIELGALTPGLYGIRIGQKCYKIARR